MNNNNDYENNTTAYTFHVFSLGANYLINLYALRVKKIVCLSFCPHNAT